MNDAWFRPKSHGYGATPANWKGWLAVILFIAAEIALALWLVVLPSERGAGPTEMGLALWLAVTIATSVGFVALCRAKTEGGWRFRWGDTPGGAGPAH